MVGTHDGPIVIFVLPFPFVLGHLNLVGYGTSRRIVFGTLCPGGSTAKREDIEAEKKGLTDPSRTLIYSFFSACERENGKWA